MGFTTAIKNAMVDALVNAAALAGGTIQISLHTADPAGTGANEVVGGSYARQTATFGTAASGGSIANTGALNFTNMPAVTITHIGIWSGAGPTFIADAALTASQSVSAGQTFVMAIGNLVANLNLAGTKISTYTKNKLLDALFRNVSFSVAQAYTSLHTADPGDTGASEVAGGTYARQSSSFAAASGGQAASDAVLRFPGMPVATVPFAGLWDAASVGNFLAGNSVTSKTYAAGDIGEVAVGGVTVG